jgi:predicted RNase H-like nuclease (RuvC/YqgF family)
MEVTSHDLMMEASNCTRYELRKICRNVETLTEENAELKAKNKALRKSNRELRKDLKWWDEQARFFGLRRDKRSFSGWKWA